MSGAMLEKRNWSYPTKIWFGAGRIADLPAACKEAGIARPLLVTDPGLAKTAMVRDAAASIGAPGFAEIKGNPVEKNVVDGIAAFRAGGHDGIVAMGGGSALDAGKVIAFMAGQTRPIWDFEDIGNWWTRADPAGIAPVVAIATTAGTGSEVGRSGVITDERNHVKKIIFHPKMMPAIVIADPVLTVGLPPTLTAATGMDALAHNLEAYCAPGFHPMADGIALEGMRLVKEWLPAAVEDGKNLEARAAMMAAASMGATAFQKGLGAIHSLSHPVGAVYDAHHGLANGVFMPYVIAFNRPAIAAKLDRIARYLDIADVLDWTIDLRRRIGIPHTADALGLEESRIPALAKMGAEDPTAASNPVAVGPAELDRLYRAALAGIVS
jgi:alcohol dehydrogenase class IV